LFQVIFNLLMFVGFVAMWMRLRRPPQDDPRMSRGLQLLQTKITVLEDLSDRTDAQVKQLSGLLDQKSRMVQNKILEAEQQVLKIDHSMNKSLEVAEIFQDKIPHQEILERQRTVEYVKAARMAHSGLTVEEISESVHLPREQIELIAKFNREQLMFDETQLPEWATRPAGADPAFALNEMDFVAGLETKPDLTEIQNNFKKAVNDANHAAANPPAGILDSKVAESLRHSMNTGMETMQPAVMSLKATAQTLRDKLVSTAEDLLRSQGQGITPAPVRPATASPTSASAAAGVLRGDSPTVKKVVFPRIEK
jgi:hypothetical protein